MRRRRTETAGHQVYLLDTMNNVLGILILALILTRLILPEVEDKGAPGAASIAALRRTLAGIALPPNPNGVTEATAAAHEQRLNALRAELAASKAARDAAAGRRASLERERLDLKSALAPLLPEDPRTSKADLEEWIARLDKERARLRGEVRDALAKYEAAVRSAPVAPDQVVTVSINAAEGGLAVESAPADAHFVMLVCFNGRVFPRDIRALEDARAAGFKAVIDKKGENGATFADIAEHFDVNDIGDEYFRVKVLVFQDTKGKSFLVRHLPRGGAGDTIEALRRGGSMIETLLRGLDRSSSIVLFRAWADSFDAYLAARALTDSLGVRCGWEPCTPDQILQFQMGRPGDGAAPEIDRTK